MATFEGKLTAGEFVITAEVVPPVAASCQMLLDRAKPLDGLVDAINVTDAASARPAMSSLAAAALLAASGREPILQLTCRDRNRIAIVSDMLGAAAQGAHNLLILHGDDPKAGDMPDATPVHDFDSKTVMSVARDMRDEARLPSGRDLAEAPHFYIGCADAPFDVPDDWTPAGLSAKIAAGAQFAQTQFCFDLAIAERYFAALKHHGITDRLKFVVGIGPLLSAKQARFMDHNLFGVSIPPAIIERLDSASDQKAEGRAICAELIAGLKAIDGICGVHIMAPMQSSTAIAETIAMTGLR